MSTFEMLFRHPMRLDTKLTCCNTHLFYQGYDNEETRIINSGGKPGARTGCQAFAGVCCRQTGFDLHHRAQTENRKPHRLFSTRYFLVQISEDRRNASFFRSARLLGHEIVAWDEEALVHLPAETYFSRRLSPVGMEHVSHLFAWGEDNAELWRQYPQLPPGIPIHITGNPRVDLLRPDMQGYYKAEADQIRETYGDFILINTNFNHVNAFYPAQNLFQPVKEPGEEAKFGQAARGMTREYAEGFRDHKQAVFEDFQKLIPELEHAFPDHTIVVRPHPTENQDIYHEIAARCRRIRVTNEGNVVPWLMAARVLIHNGCTTGVEAFVMRVPAVSYRKTVNDYYDDGFYRLPNRLSHQCFDFEELRATLRAFFTVNWALPGGMKEKRL